MDHASPVDSRPADISPQDLARSEQFFSNFVTCSKWGIVAVAVLLACMGFFLV